MSVKIENTSVKVSRIEYIDIAKGIGIILVVLGHIVNAVGLTQLYINVFHMPLFFIIAGFCYAPNRYKILVDYIERKTKAIILPTIYMVGLNIVLSFLFVNDYYSINNVLECKLPNAMWFLPILFLTEVLCYNILKFRERWHYIAILVLYVLSYVLNDRVCILNIACVPYACLFYIVGYKLKRYIVKTNETYNNRYLVLSYLLLMVPYIYIYIYNDSIKMSDNHIGKNGFLVTLLAISTTISILNISKHIEKLTIVKTLLAYLGRNSIIILCLHIFFIHFSVDYISPLLTNHLTYKACEFFTIWLGCVVCIELINKYAKFLIGK